MSKSKSKKPVEEVVIIPIYAEGSPNDLALFERELRKRGFITNANEGGGFINLPAAACETYVADIRVGFRKAVQS